MMVCTWSSGKGTERMHDHICNCIWHISFCAKFDPETVDLIYSMYSSCSHRNLQYERITGPVSTIVAVNTSNEDDLRF